MSKIIRVQRIEDATAVHPQAGEQAAIDIALAWLGVPPVHHEQATTELLEDDIWVVRRTSDSRIFIVPAEEFKTEFVEVLGG